ncbi:MAG: hypothetical protein P8I13_06895 [Porticoccaceae bacterium]|nr:hypothetical protein [Porticoccaceae bacterium]
MNQSSTQASEQTYEEQFESSSSHQGAVILPTSINENEFQLVYQSREESVGGTKLRMAKNIVDFAKSYRCNYILLIDGSCWISPDKGISLLAQIEGNEKLDKYDYVVFPLDHATYIAKINEGIVVEERVRPTDQAVNYLQQQKTAEIAILAGGQAYEQLASHEFVVNCDLVLLTSESEAAKYRFKSLNLALITHKLFHQRLLIPVAYTAVPLIIIAFLFSPLYNIKKTKATYDVSGSFLDLDINSKVPRTLEPAVKKVPQAPKVILNNSASHVLIAISPWVTGNTIDFLKTCRLKSILLSKKYLIFTGERMSNIKKNQLGCGNARLDEIAQANNLELIRSENTWTFSLEIQPKTAQTTHRKVYSETLERLELLSQIIGLRLNILSTQKDGDKQRLKVLFQGKNLNTEILTILSQGLSKHAAEFIKGSIKFNPNNLDLIDAQLEIDIHTQSSDTL